MRQPRPTERLIAAVLAVTQITGCGSAWHRPVGVTPANAVTTWHPEVIRASAGDRIVEVHDPAVRADTLVGLVFAGRRPGVFALSRDDVATLSPTGTGAVVTLRDSSLLQIERLWERADSMGGPGWALRRGKRFAVPLHAVGWIELKRIPLDALAPGQPVRLRLAGSTGGSQRAVFSGVVGDSLIVSVEDQERKVGLASIDRLDVLTGRRGHAALGALIGVLVPLALAAAIMVSADKDCDVWATWCPEELPLVMVIVVVGVPAGVLLFGVVGAASSSERWERVPLDRAFPARRP